MKPEFFKMVPKGVGIHARRIYIKYGSLAAHAEMESEIVHAASLIGSLAPDIIVLGSTMTGVTKGTEQESLLRNQIADFSKITTVSTANAVTAVMKALEVKKVSAATAYREEENNRERGFLEAHGIKVNKSKRLGYETPVES